MTKTKKSFNRRLFVSITFTISLSIVVLSALFLYLVPNFRTATFFIGELFTSIRGYVLEDHQLESMLYAKTFLIDVMSLWPLIPIVWINNSRKIKRKLAIFLTIICCLLMVGSNIATFAIPSSPLRNIPVLTELKKAEFIFIRVDHIHRFIKNFTGLYILYAFPFILQFGMFIMIYFMTDSRHKPVTYVFFSLLALITPYVGSFIFIFIVAILSFLAIAALVVGIAILFVKSDFDTGGSYSDDEDETKKDGYSSSFIYEPRGMHAGYDSADHEVFHDGQGGYLREDGSPYYGIVHCFRD